MLICGFSRPQGLSYGSIHLFLCALRHHQLFNGGNDPALHFLHYLHYVLRGCHKLLLLATRPRQLPITPSILTLLYHRWSSVAQNYDIVCMWAVCCIGFLAFCVQGSLLAKSWAAYDPGMLSLCDVAVDSKLKPSVLQLTIRSWSDVAPGVYWRQHPMPSLCFIWLTSLLDHQLRVHYSFLILAIPSHGIF